LKSLPVVEVIESPQAAASADSPSPSYGLLQPSSSYVTSVPPEPAIGNCNSESKAFLTLDSFVSI
jgi:hypothetical protein